MSSHSYSTWCYFCGASDSAMICEDNKPPSTDFTCVECGMMSVTKWERMDLAELNEYREDYALEPLSELPKLKGDY